MDERHEVQKSKYCSFSPPWLRYVDTQNVGESRDGRYPASQGGDLCCAAVVINGNLLPRVGAR